MPPNTPTKEEQDDGKARVGFTGEENMVLPKASGDEHGRRKGGWVDARRTDCSRGQQRREIAVSIRLDDEPHASSVVVLLARQRRVRASDVTVVLRFETNIHMKAREIWFLMLRWKQLRNEASNEIRNTVTGVGRGEALKL